MSCASENPKRLETCADWAAAHRYQNRPGTGCTYGEQAGEAPWSAPLSDNMLAVAGFAGGLFVSLMIVLALNFWRRPPVHPS